MTTHLSTQACVSPAYREIHGYISHLEAPFSLDDIQGFNVIYKRCYRTLSYDERREVEAFVDTLIEHVERKEWASRIYGVV